MSFIKPTSPWSQYPECETILRESYLAKFSFAQIANKIRALTGIIFTRNACIGRARRIALPPRASPIKKNGSSNKRKQGVDGALHSKIRTRPTRVGLMPLELPELPPSPLPFLGLTFIELQEGQCKFPQGGDGEPTYFCGQAQYDKNPYCAFHYRICYTRPPTPVERGKFSWHDRRVS